MSTVNKVISGLEILKKYADPDDVGFVESQPDYLICGV